MTGKFCMGFFWPVIIESIAVLLQADGTYSSQFNPNGAVSRQEFEEFRADVNTKLDKLLQAFAEDRLALCEPPEKVLSLDEQKKRMRRDANQVPKLEEELAQLKGQFEEFRESMSTKMEKVLKTLVKDGYLAKMLQGPPGEKGDSGEKGEPGVMGPPGLPGPYVNVAPIVNRLDKVERFLKGADQEMWPHILYSTNAGGIYAYSIITGDVRNIVNSTEDIYGVAFDSMHQKLYYSTNQKIYRATPASADAQTVLSSTQYGWITALAFDSVTGNIYGASWSGYIFVCKATPAGSLSCKTLLSGKGNVLGIALNPSDGTMFWTQRNPGRIWKAKMDGSGAAEIVTGLDGPSGITVDDDTSKVIWADANSHEVRSNSLDGGQLKTVIRDSNGTAPFGTVLHKDQLYYGSFSAKSLHSSTKLGQDVRLIFSGVHHIRHLTLLPNVNLPKTRKNHCEDKSCSGICALASNSARCVS